MRYRLHCFAQSGNAYKAALMLALCDADWEAVFVDFFNGGTRTPEYLALNPMGEAPVLEVDAGPTLSQSGVILDYLAEAEGRFGAETRAERHEILRWLLFDNHKLTSYIATLRFLKQFAKQDPNEVSAFLEQRATTALGVLERHLAERAFVLGSRPTIADLSLCGYLFWPEEIGIDLDAFAAVSAWLERIRALPGWRHPYELMPGSVPGSGVTPSARRH